MIWGASHGSGNRSAVAGPPQVSAPRAVGVASIDIADVRYVHRVPDGAIIHSGHVLSRFGIDGRTTWSRGDLGVTQVVAVTSAPGDGIVVAVCGTHRLVAIAADSGDVLWGHSDPELRSLIGHGSVRVLPRQTGISLFVAPNYSTQVSRIDLDPPGPARFRWTHEFGASIDAGFGPVLAIGDVLARGHDQLVISGRTGSDYGESEEVSSERLVFGRSDGLLYQAILDLDDGRLLTDTAYAPDPGGYPCARPYGLLDVASAGTHDIVLVSCQVEEYASVTTGGARLARRWSRFVEKDWPEDELELRPQTTSVADVFGDGRPRLVVGTWDGRRWCTEVLDVLGDEATNAVEIYEGAYFWGCVDLDGDGVPEIVTSLEPARAVASRTTIRVIDARTGLDVDTRADVSIVVMRDDDLPVSRAFHAERHGIATIRTSAGAALVLVDDEGTMLWAPRRHAPPLDRRVWPDPTTRVDDRGAGPALTDGRGRVVLLQDDGEPLAVLRPNASTPRPILVGSPALLIDRSGPGRLGVWALGSDAAERVSELPGDAPAVHRSARGTVALAVHVHEVGAHEVRVYALDTPEPELLWTRPVLAPVDNLIAFGDEFHLLVTTRTGPHSTATFLLDGEGSTLWTDPRHGAHLSLPTGFQAPDGTWLVAYEDHGLLRIRDLAGHVRLDQDWPAAYSTPIDAGEGILVRANATHGLRVVDLDGEVRWERAYGLFEIFPGTTAVMCIAGRRVLVVAKRGGELDVLSLDGGALLASHAIGPQADNLPIVAIGESLLVGLLDGTLRAMHPLTGVVHWSHCLDAAIESLAAQSVGAEHHLAVGTADGMIHILRLSDASRKEP